MPPSPRVSVAMCTYNGASFVRAQLESILGQSRAPDEIIACDDGSTDATGKIVRSIAGNSAVPIRFEVNPARLGVTKNFEKAISLCTGDVIFLCDQDDLWHPEKVAKLVACFDDPAVGLAFSNAEVVNEDLSPAGYSLWQSVWFDPAEQAAMRNGNAMPALLRHAIAAGSTLAFRAEHLPLVLPIPDFPNSHDIWITLVIACVARLVPLDENLIRYRLHGENAVGLKNHNLLGQIKMARWQINSGAFRYAAELHQAALDRIAVVQRDDERMARTKALLREKIAHSRVRDELPRNWFARLPVVAREQRAGNYRQYSYGFKSLLQDLFLR